MAQTLNVQSRSVSENIVQNYKLNSYPAEASRHQHKSSDFTSSDSTLTLCTLYFQSTKVLMLSILMLYAVTRPSPSYNAKKNT